MTALTIPALEPAIHKTNLWLEELAEQMNGDYHHAYQGLRATLHALRDRLPVEETSDLAAQLPLIIRGIYYEGWNPSHTPVPEKDLDSFLQRIAGEMGGGAPPDPGQAARAVFKLLSAHCTAGQINHVRGSLPKELQALWPQ